jgi:polyferredoxin
MTAHDHNKTLGSIFGLLSILLATILTAVLGQSLLKGKVVPGTIMQDPFLCKAVPIGLTLSLFLFAASFGLLKRRRWGRSLSLLISSMFIFFYPLGTMLSVYAWWFLHSEGGKQLYSRGPP